ncbi:hypothetical protein E4T48_02434 [Aureobasidium sp. EXF-10727]|nr:hypothetical protein E4T48_02434 [Aureobasidium sp. EXF-10727]
MELASSEVRSPESKPAEVKPDLLRCDQDGCNKWWRKADLKILGTDGFQKCPHCREVNTTPTKYWIGGLSGPYREQSYDYPARMPQTPQTHSLPLKGPADRTGSAKRQISSSSPMSTSPQNKKARTSLQQSTPIKATGVAEPAKMERKDSLQGTLATPSKEPSLEMFRSKSDHLFVAWKACKGCPDLHKEKELKEAEGRLRVLHSSVPKNERTVQESQNEQQATMADLKKKEVFQEKLDALIAEAELDRGEHKTIKDRWYMSARQHVQLAYERNNRASKTLEDARKQMAEAKTLEMNARQQVDAVKAERNQLKGFAEFMSNCILPSSKGA